MRSNRNPLSFLLLSLTFLGLTACGSGDSDETSPLLTVDAVTTPSATTAFELSGTVEAGAEIEIDLTTADGGATSGTVGAVDFAPSAPGVDMWETTLADLAVGNTLVNITATDRTGNMNQARFFVTVDQTPPEVATDASGNTGVFYTAGGDVEVWFSETILRESLSGDSFYVTGESDVEIAGTILPEAENASIYAFSPEDPLAAGEYTLTLTGAITDEAGNALLLTDDATGEELESKTFSVTVPAAAP